MRHIHAKLGECHSGKQCNEARDQLDQCLHERRPLSSEPVMLKFASLDKNSPREQNVTKSRLGKD